MSIEDLKDKNFSPYISDLIPIVSHYDTKTLLTKNADLVQVIKVEGFLKKEFFNEKQSLKQKIRESIKKHVNDRSVTIHMHVIRKYQNILSSKYIGKEKHIKTIEEKWCKSNSWDNQLVNTLYITLVRQGPRMSLVSIKDFFNILVPFVLKQKYSKYLKSSCEILSDISSKITKDLTAFSSRILSVFEEGQKSYSELVSFYYYLTHFKEKNLEIVKADFSELLSDIDIVSNSNIVELNSPNKKTYLAAISLKAMSDINPELLDFILQCKSRFVLSESINFVSSAKALEYPNQYYDTVRSLKKTNIMEYIDLPFLLNLEDGTQNAFCSLQTNIIFHDDDIEQLKENVSIIANNIKKIGIKSVREDYNLPSIIFANMPGNYYYSNRGYYNATNMALVFSEIHSKKTGKYNGSKWGYPVTILRTADSGYYHFNFHDNDNGNTLIIGPKDGGKTILSHFLLIQSLKFDINIIYFDIDGRGKNFIESINGVYIPLKPEDKSSPIQIDILDIDNYKGNIDWFVSMILRICAGDDSYRYSNKSYIKNFKDFARNLIKIKTPGKRLKYFDEFIEKYDDSTIKANYKKFFKSDFFKKFFAKNKLDFLENKKHTTVDFSKIVNKTQVFTPFFNLLMLKTPDLLIDGKNIINMNSANFLFESFIFKNYLSDWMDQIIKKNSMLILSKEIDKKSSNIDSLSKTIDKFSTKLYLSDRMLNKEFKYSLNLTNQEFNYIKGYSSSKRKILVKHAEDSVFVEMNLSNVRDILKYL